MTAQSAIPLKWYVPFANGDAGRVELPVTTADPTRASQTLGFPPLTMQPPESGGVPPQGEDFNGGMNQVARIAWWVLNGGGWPYDSTFATNSNINGYPNGATLQAADFRGNWINTADNNQNNPDTNGTNWVPGFQYGTTALTGLTGGTVTPTPAQAAKGAITLAGTLASALTVVLPTWTKNWTITNSTTGAFVTIVKTAAGSGVTIPQNSLPTRVSGDGTNIVQAAENVAGATSPTNPVPMAQAAGVVGTVRNLVMSVTVASATATLTADEIIVETALGGVRYCLPSFSKTINLATTGAGGMDTGAAPVSGYVALYAIWNPSTSTAALLATNAANLVGNVYGGANMPAGYTASALVSVVPTNASGQFPILTQRGRDVGVAEVTAVSTSSVFAFSGFSIASAIPKNAITVSGILSVTNASATGSTTLSLSIYDGAQGIGTQQCVMTGQTGTTGGAAPFGRSKIITAQNIFLRTTSAGAGGGTPTYIVTITGYSF